MKNKKYFEILFLFFFIILIHSYLPTIKETLSNIGSADFNWQPTKCVFEGINHYSSYLIRDSKCLIFMSQLGEYAQGMYIILYPFSLLDWEMAKTSWLIINILLLLFIVYFLSKKNELDPIEILFVLFVTFYTIVTRVNFIMGQHTILILTFLSLPFIWKNKVTYIFSGVSYFKYHIGYGLFLFFLVSKKYKTLFLSLLPCIIGWLTYSFITDTGLIENLFQPFNLALHNAEEGNVANNLFLFSFIKKIPFLSNFNYLIILVLTLLFNVFFLIKIKQTSSDLLKLSLLGLLILISTPHWGHDNILLIPFLIYTVKNYNQKKNLFRFNLFFTIYFLHLYKGIQDYSAKFLKLIELNNNIIELSYLLFSYLNLAILIFLIIINLNFHNKVKKYNNG